MTRRDLSIAITLNEVYNTHELLQRHVDVLVRKLQTDFYEMSYMMLISDWLQAPDADHPLRQLLKELGAAPAQLPREENRPITLALSSRWEVAPNDGTKRGKKKGKGRVV